LVKDSIICHFSLKVIQNRVKKRVSLALKCSTSSSMEELLERSFKSLDAMGIGK
jgi:hypothetical protein